MVKNVAVLWDDEVNWEGEHPFDAEGMNQTYRYFSELCSGKGLNVFIGSFEWYDSGRMDKCFVYNGQEWEKVEDKSVDTVFDKYRFDKGTLELKKEIDRTHPVLNRFEVERVCKDKLLASERFPENHPETLRATEENVEKVLESYGKAVLKPLSAHAGKDVRVIEEVSEYHNEEGIVQQFIDSRSGIPELSIEGIHDLRIILVDGEKVLSYVRQPSSGYVANVSRGGSMEFVDLENIPNEADEIVEKVRDRLGESNYVCGIDLIFDEEQKPWILELNSKPGLNFYGDEEIKSSKKRYIESVVDSLAEIS